MKSALVVVVALAAVAQARQTETLADWNSLPAVLKDYKLSLITTSGARLKAVLLESGPYAFKLDVSSSSDTLHFPKGEYVVPHDGIAEIHAWIGKRSFVQFWEVAVATPVRMMGDECLFYFWAEPYCMGWATGGLAISPLVAAIDYIHPTGHYDYRLQRAGTSRMRR